MNIYTIIVTYNASYWLRKCLDSIYASDIKVEIIIIDNGSTDGSQEIIKEEYPLIELIESKVNLGFGRANNIGIKRAQEKGADYYFLLNQDAWIQPNTIQNLLKIALENREYGILSPMHLNGSGDKFESVFFDKHNYQLNNLLLNVLNKNDYPNIIATSFVQAACWFINKDVINNVGVFDPIFFHYGEDNNYCQRVLYHDFKIGILPDTFVYHDSKSESDKKRNIKYDLMRFTSSFLSKVANINLDDKLRLKIYWYSLRSSFLSSFSNIFKLSFRNSYIEFLKFIVIIKSYHSIKKSVRENRVKLNT